MKRRKIKSSIIAGTVSELCFKANTVLRKDVVGALTAALKREKKGSLSEEMLKVLIDNARIARKKKIPICQDTGMVSIFIEYGRQVIVEGGSITDAVNLGIKAAYKKHYFRKSVVSDPLSRKNTGNNAPAVIHIEMTEGNRIGMDIMPKGFGSENKSRLVMLNPTCGEDEIIDFCVETVRMAGPDACPPYVLGIGMGGTMDSVCCLAKKALLAPLNRVNSDRRMARLEKKIREKTNRLGIGIMGLGGKTTVLGVNVEAYSTHIAGLPLAVNISCHALRSAHAVI